MSADNSIAREGREAEQPAERSGFEIPPELVARYDVRVVDGPDGEQRLGLFRPGDRDNPAIEIADDRIVARAEDAETVASLVQIAQHNGWDRIEVAGSSEFRKAVWTAATREGLTVTGYEPSFAEQERLAAAREDAERRQARDAAAPGASAPVATTVSVAATRPAGEGREETVTLAAQDDAALDADDRRLLLTLSRHIEDRKTLRDADDPALDRFQREVRAERIEANRVALEGALDRALESPALAGAFTRSGYDAEALRRAGESDQWDGEIAMAIDRVRADLDRGDRASVGGASAALAEEMVAEREDVATAEADTAAPVRPVAHAPTPREREETAERHHESEALAELFLHGEPGRLAGEPRLAGALQAQSVMEQHIGEVFGGDAARIASANLESRQMISDALRRGLDVSVREPSPVRQIELALIRPELER